MAQVLKDEVRERILRAALDRFSTVGWAGTTVASIAAAAGLSVGNVYRYFPGKVELLEAAAPEGEVAAIVLELGRKLRFLADRGLGIEEGGEELANMQASMAELLWEKKALLGFLIGGAAGSPREGFPEELAKALGAAFSAWAAKRGGKPPRAALHLVAGLYGNLIAMAGTTLLASRSSQAFERDFSLLLEYHSRGMEALARTWKDAADRAAEQGEE